jgi:hypothetical protein
MNNENSTPVLSTTAIDEWIDRRVAIVTSKGCVLAIHAQDAQNQTPSKVSTKHGTPTIFVLERAPLNDDAIAFRVEGSHKYLTVVMYGDEERNRVADVLASHPTLLPELIPCVVNFTAGTATKETNFEGAGFNYNPMTAQVTNSPNNLQVFQLEPTGRTNMFGVKTLFGTYWRHQHWKSQISQSDHCMGDEQFYFRIDNEDEDEEDEESEDEEDEDESDDEDDEDEEDEESE